MQEASLRFVGSKMHLEAFAALLGKNEQAKNLVVFFLIFMDNVFLVEYVDLLLLTLIRLKQYHHIAH